jgi:hypothetical protein
MGYQLSVGGNSSDYAAGKTPMATSLQDAQDLSEGPTNNPSSGDCVGYGSGRLSYREHASKWALGGVNDEACKNPSLSFFWSGLQGHM